MSLFQTKKTEAKLDDFFPIGKDDWSAYHAAASRYKPWELKIIKENPDCLWRVFNHNHTLLGVFPNRKLADEEARFYTSMTGNAAYVLHEDMI